MKCLFLLMTICPIVGFSQYTYFNVQEDNLDWSVSFSSEVELRDDQFIVCGQSVSDDVIGFQFSSKNEYGEAEEYLHFEDVEGIIEDAHSDSFKAVEDGYITCINGSNYTQFIKFNLGGELLWQLQNPYPDSMGVDILFVRELMGGEYLFVGNKNVSISEETTLNKLYLIKIGIDGSVYWEVEETLTENSDLVFTRTIEQENGNIILLGVEEGENILVRTNSFGIIQNTEEDIYRWSGGEYYNHQPFMVKDSNNEISVMYEIGQSLIDEEDENSINYTFNILRFDSETMVPTETIEFPELYPRHLIADYLKTPDGGYAVLGQDWNFAPVRSFIKKYSSEHEEEWMNYYVHSEYTDSTNVLFDFEIANDGGFICAGEASGNDISEYPLQSWLLKIDACGDAEDLSCPMSIEEINHTIQIDLYPNPAREYLKVSLPLPISGDITLSFYDNLGKELQRVSEFLYSENELEIPLVNLPSGLYSFQFRHKTIIGSARFVKE